jgi:Uma2 family endonuclease
MSLDQWAAMPEDDPGELVDGWLVEEEVADTPHELVVAWLIVKLVLWGAARKIIVLPSEVRYAVSSHAGRKPDVSMFFSRAQKLPRKGAITRPPDVMIEVVSPTPRDGRRDRVDKLGEYAEFGVAWYWIVDPRLRTFEVLRLDAEGNYAHVTSAATGVIEPPGCEGLILDLDAMWRESDEVLEEPTED